MKNYLGIILICLLPQLLPATGGELIVFLGDPKAAVTKDFREHFLPEIKEMAQSQGVTFIEKSIAKGAPSEVAFTPSLYFQNHLGRSLYIGRYRYIDKIKTFIRTVSRMPQAPATNEKHNVLIWKRDRTNVYSPVKITTLAGSVPQDHDNQAFQQAALAALARGAAESKLEATFLAARTDRAIYLALYPFLGADGKFFLSAEVYSQFNCIEPIYKRFDHPFSGDWNHWQQVFEAAGKALQDIVAERLSSPENGDGLVPVPSNTPVKTWETLGLGLPAAPTAETGAVTGVATLGTNWEFGGPAEPGSAVLNFSFAPPLDHYAGEIGTLFGDLEFAAGPNINEAKGRFGIETASLTMGDPALDAHVHEIIAIVAHPKAYFTFERITSVEHPEIAFGALTQCAIQGTMEFMGFKVGVEVKAQLEPLIGEDGQPRILVDATFALRLKKNFGLDGPDGPQPAADTMDFLLHFHLKPAG